MKHTLTFFASLCLLASHAITATPAKPNILFIVGDDMGYADVGFHGCKDIPTPNLDALAAVGRAVHQRLRQRAVLLADARGTADRPLPDALRPRVQSRRQPGAARHRDDHRRPAQGRRLRHRPRRQMASRRAAGHAPAEARLRRVLRLPRRRAQLLRAAGILRGTEPVKELDYTTDAFGREAVAFIERHKAEPWFLYLAFNAVHTPMHATDDRLAKFPASPTSSAAPTTP